MIRASIVGGSGYVGGELLRLLLGHPAVQVTAVTSRSQKAKPVSKIHQNLAKLTDLAFVDEKLDALAEVSDVIFLALPHGKSMQRVPAVIDRVRVVDLGADYRLKDARVFAQYYGMEHTSPELLREAVYGLTEFNREAIRNARLVACPGCYPTGALLALMPLFMKGLLSSNVVVDSKTGSSGSGSTPSFPTHHPERAQDFTAYGLFRHRHYPEIVQELLGCTSQPLDLTFTPHSTPMVRGIFTTAYVFLDQSISHGDLSEIFMQYYAQEVFIRLVEQARSAVVTHSNYCDISFACDRHKVIITSAIDNLIKGAAGQAVQNMNVMFDLPEQMGLTFPGTHP